MFTVFTGGQLGRVKGKPALRGLFGVPNTHGAMDMNHRNIMSQLPAENNSAFCFDAQVGNGSHAILFSLNERTEVLI